MAVDDRIRVGLVGYGLGGEVFHAPLIESEPRMRLAAVVTSNEERARGVRSRYPGTRVHATLTEMLADPGELDLVVITTPNSHHAEQAAAALDAGLPVVVDKPFTATAAEARDVITRARERALMLTVFQNRRWDNDMRTVRELIDTGALGKVHRFESRFERWVPEPKDSWRDRGGPDEAAGVLYDLGSHLVDQALCLFGTVRSVYAEMDTHRADVFADDDTFLALRHADGTRSHLWMGKLAAQPGPRFRVLGDAGAYTKYGLDPQEAALREGKLPGESDWGVEPESEWGIVGVPSDERPYPSKPGCYQDFYAGVASSLDSDTPPPVAPEDALACLSVIEAARESVAGGGVVAPPVDPVTPTGSSA